MPKSVKDHLSIFGPVIQKDGETDESAVEFASFGGARRMDEDLRGGRKVQPPALIRLNQRFLTGFFVRERGDVLLLLALPFRFRLQGDRQPRDELRPEAFTVQIPQVQFRAQFINLLKKSKIN